ncbi:solute carrier family 25 member 45 isoform X2 [Chanos chanos]|uniref:Solute carrier family 25 member 45 isoform X2 n=1 Tax=Chanos chanos TaxID=29144 RepID=A0A6J2WWP1_CHACN|nr:solute carrier family 25 member 45-like isoform X2 [Chanos chanos]
MPFVEFIAGWISGAVGLVVGHPMDTVKVRLQSQSKYKGIFDCVARTYTHEGVFVTAPIDLVKVRLQNQTRMDQYRGPVHCLSVIFRQDGFRGLFRGMWALALRDIPCYGLYFLPYEVTCRMLTEKGKEPGSFAVLMAGGIAGVVTWAFATPMDVVKTRLQMSGGGGRVYRGTLHCVTVSLREEGIRVFFKGLLLNSLRAFPVNAATFLSYESLIRTFTR